MRELCIVLIALLSSVSVHAQLVHTGTYVMSQGPVEVTRETYTFDGTTLADTVDFPSRGIRMESVARYDDVQYPVSYSLQLFRGQSEVPVQRVDVTFGDSAAVWSTHTELGDSTGVTLLDGPCGFMQNLVFAHLAVALLNYDHAAGGEQIFDVWIAEQAAVLNMAIEFSSSTEGTVDIAGTVMNVDVDDTGWLRSASVPSQNVSVRSMAQTSPDG